MTARTLTCVLLVLCCQSNENKIIINLDHQVTALRWLMVAIKYSLIFAILKEIFPVSLKA